jgi:hemoglobin-like flavoprotein
MERQHLKLMDMIAAIVGALDKREIFQSIIRHMGRQHAQFGVKSSHFVAFVTLPPTFIQRRLESDGR